MSELNKQDIAAAGEAIRSYLKGEGVYLTQSQALGAIGAVVLGSSMGVEDVGAEAALKLRKKQLVAMAAVLSHPGLDGAYSQLGLSGQRAYALSEVIELLPSTMLATLDQDTLLAALERLSYQTRPELELDWAHPLMLRMAEVETLLRLKSGFDEELAARMGGQFSSFTGRNPSFAINIYKQEGWWAAIKRLKKEFGVDVKPGPLSIWSDREQAHWVDNAGWARDGWSATGYTIDDLYQKKLEPGERWILWTELSKEKMILGPGNSAVMDPFSVSERALFELSTTSLRSFLTAITVVKESDPVSLLEHGVVGRAKTAQQLLDAKEGRPSELSTRLVAQVCKQLPTFSAEDVEQILKDRGFDAARSYFEHEQGIAIRLGSFLRYSSTAGKFLDVEGGFTDDPDEAAGYYEASATDLKPGERWTNYSPMKK